MLRTFEDETVDLIMTSPPYNIGKKYEKRRRLEIYLKEQEQVIEQLVRVLSPRGNICWQVGTYVHNGEIVPLDYHYYEIFNRLLKKEESGNFVA